MSLRENLTDSLALPSGTRSTTAISCKSWQPNTSWQFLQLGKMVTVCHPPKIPDCLTCQIGPVPYEYQNTTNTCAVERLEKLEDPAQFWIELLKNRMQKRDEVIHIELLSINDPCWYWRLILRAWNMQIHRVVVDKLMVNVELVMFRNTFLLIKIFSTFLTIKWWPIIWCVFYSSCPSCSYYHTLTDH